MEDYAGDNNPYRGTESHGVAQTVKPHDPETYGVDGDHPDGIPVVLEIEPVHEPAPVPVRIVQEYRRERHEYGTDRILLDFTLARNPANRAVEIVGRDDTRVSIRLKNADDNMGILIGHSREETAMRGYLMSPGETLTLTTESPIFATVIAIPAMTFPDDTALLTYIAEYVVKAE
jgi:hypothetical protein